MLSLYKWLTLSVLVQEPRLGFPKLDIENESMLTLLRSIEAKFLAARPSGCAPAGSAQDRFNAYMGPIRDELKTQKERKEAREHERLAAERAVKEDALAAAREINEGRRRNYVCVASINSLALHR
jgi:hypothetical protein